MDGIGQDRLGQDRLGKDRLDKQQHISNTCNPLNFND